MMLMFYISKGFLKMKLKAYADIIKNLNHIQKKYHELENKKLISDSELVKTFPDEIFIPVEISNNTTSRIFNKTILNLSRIVKCFL